MPKALDTEIKAISQRISQLPQDPPGTKNYPYSNKIPHTIKVIHLPLEEMIQNIRDIID